MSALQKHFIASDSLEGLQITVDILILDFIISKLKNTWLSGVNLLVHRTGDTFKQSTRYLLCG